ncbi:ribosome maturation factor RimM [Haoranjiania flava]|uniref:Ribosome maturation factor RimM n=1 Tax=Haoranjiania flava TaxID=1856322 RepID=A0AAE3IKG9_9BACT|nr:ribosome maturation factor RimM [Haoranjiania flava]MCU7693952.1 ribosome maturation factor RimM [Haoranjiania flava]
MTEYIHIGRIVASHGVHGDVVVVHSLGSRNNFKDVKALFVEQVKNSYIPHFISSATARDAEQTQVKLEGTDSKESAHRLIKKNVWITEADFNRIADKNAPISLLGYKIYNRQDLLGTVEEVIEQPHQVLLKTNFKNKEVLVPLHAGTLEAVDRKTKEVRVILPDGLLEIYLEN